MDAPFLFFCQICVACLHRKHLVSWHSAPESENKIRRRHWQCGWWSIQFLLFFFHDITQIILMKMMKQCLPHKICRGQCLRLPQCPHVPVSITHETDNWCQAESGCGGQIDNIHIHTIVNLLICANHWFYKQQNDTEWAWALYGLFIWNMLLIFLLHHVFLLSIVSGPECPISRADRWWEPMWGLRQKTRELAYYMTLDTNYLCRKSWENAIVQWWMYYNNTITMSRLLQYLGCPTQFVTTRLISLIMSMLPPTRAIFLHYSFYLEQEAHEWKVQKGAVITCDTIS